VCFLVFQAGLVRVRREREAEKARLAKPPQRKRVVEPSKESSLYGYFRKNIEHLEGLKLQREEEKKKKHDRKGRLERREQILRKKIGLETVGSTKDVYFIISLFHYFIISLFHYFIFPFIFVFPSLYACLTTRSFISVMHCSLGLALSEVKRLHRQDAVPNLMKMRKVLLSGAEDDLPSHPLGVATRGRRN
jgi:hypothetical protein